MAESEGFEPSMGDKAHTPLAGERLQPLGQLSNYFLVELNCRSLIRVHQIALF